MTCPIATRFTANRLCRDCAGGREWRATIHNCRGNLAESLAFSLRNATARQFGLFLRNVHQFIALTEYGRDWLIKEVDVAEEKITIQPCVVPMPSASTSRAPTRDYIGFAGRFSFEKGAHLAIEAARRAAVPLRLAGNSATHPDIRPGDDIACVLTPRRADLEAFYRDARFIVVPSLFEETFSLVSAEAIESWNPGARGAHRRPAIHGERRRGRRNFPRRRRRRPGHGDETSLEQSRALCKIWRRRTAAESRTNSMRLCISASCARPMNAQSP